MEFKEIIKILLQMEPEQLKTVLMFLRHLNSQKSEEKPED